MLSPYQYVLGEPTRGRILARGNPIIDDCNPTIANARLIAAAPDLLAALTRLLDSPDLGLESLEPETIEACEQAHAALAKARGHE